MTTNPSPLDNSITYSCSPTLPEDDIIDSILDAHNDRQQIRSILDEHGVIDHTRDYPAALGILLSTIAGTRIFPRRPGVHRALAYCGLMLIGRCELSEPEVAKLCGVSKGDISRWKREMEERWGVESSGVRRSESARQVFSEVNAEVEKRKRVQRRKCVNSWNSKFKAKARK